MAVQQYFLSISMDQLIGFGKVTSLKMLQHFFRLYVAIGEINLKENPVKIIRPYDHTEPFDHLIEKLKKGVVILKIRKSDNFRCHDGVKGDHHIGTNGNV